jgi:hypothetical protein
METLYISVKLLRLADSDGLAKLRFCHETFAEFVICTAETFTTDLVAFKSLDPSGHWQVAGEVAGGKLALTNDFGGGHWQA